MTDLNFTTIAKRRIGTLAFSCLLSTLGAALGLVPFVVIYLIAVHVFGQPESAIDFNYVWMISLIALGSVILKGVAVASSLHFSHVAAYDILYDARIELAKKLGTLPLGFFDRRNTGTIKRVIHEDVEQMEEGLAHMAPDFTAGVVVPLLTLIIMYVINWQMATVTLVSAVLAVLSFMFMYSIYSSSGMKEYYELSDRMNSAVIQYINGMKVIKTFTRSRASFADLKATIQDMRNFYTNFAPKIQKPYALVQVIFRATPLFVLPAGLIFYNQGILDLPTLIFFLVISLGFTRPIYNFLMQGIMAIYQIQNGHQRINALLAEPSLVDPTSPQQPQGYQLEFKDVYFTYSAEPPPADGSQSADANYVLKGINLSIPQGSVTALVGPSGSGKTTIARLIPRFWDVTNGSIEIGGIDIRAMSMHDLMEQVSFVFQDVFLFNDTFYENIRLGKPDAPREDIIAAAKLARCHDFIMEMGGYDYHIGENGAKLSGGERQRISIARAILKNAPIIVLDEATAFVDPENESQIQEAIASLLMSEPNRPKTLVVVAHRLSTITEADQIVLINDGQIAAVGQHPELLVTNELYQTLWQAYNDAQTWQFSNDGPMTKLNINQNTAYDGEYEPLHNPFDPLTTAKSTYQKLTALATGEEKLLRLSILWKFFEGGFIAYPALIIYLALVALFGAGITSAQIGWLTLGLVAIFAGQYLFVYLSTVSFIKLDTNIQRNLRLFLSDYLRRLPLGFFTQRDVGTIDALFTTNIQFLETRTFITLFISAAVSPVLIFLFALFLDWRMALAMGLGLPVAGFILSKTFVIFDRVWQVQSQARKKANGRMVEYIQGIGVIRAFNLSGNQFAQFEQAMNHYRLASRHTSTALSPTIASYLAVLEIGFAALLVAGAYFYSAGTLSLAVYLIFMMLGLAFYLPMMLGGDTVALQRIIENSIRNVNEFLKSPLLPEVTTSQPPQGYAIEFDAVHFSYDDEKVLNGVSFTIPENQMVALVGPSGSGKTTITNLLARFWDVDSGTVKVGGVDVRHMSSDDLLRQMTMVFQDVYLFNDTIMNNIRFANPAATDEQVFAASRLACAHEFIVEMAEGYETIVGEGGSTLSGGQKQRISIARAILKDAPIVLLDEATASIDPENERLIQQAFNALTQHKTVIIIAHRLSTVQAADVILVLDKGQILQRGTHDVLLTKAGLYRHFWDERQKSKSWKIGEEIEAKPTSIPTF